MRRAEDFEDDLDEDTDDDDMDDSDGSDSDAGSDNGVSSKELMSKLEAEIKESPFNAELHAALISALREAANLDRLRAVRKRAAEKVALSEPLWFEWLQDEKSLADDEDFQELKALHERACIACPLSSRIWLAQCSLLQGKLSDKEDGVEKIREVYEAAVDVLGLHPTEGVEIWAEFRDFEETLLQKLEDKDARAKQVHRVRSLFLRQLALPLPGLERLREAFVTFDAGLEAAIRDPMAAAKAEAIMAEGIEGWQQREALEKRLLDASRPSVGITAAGSVDEKAAEVSAELLSIEEASEDPKRILLAHLRAVHGSPSDEQRWHKLMRFIEGTLKDQSKLVNSLESAVRNCPHCKDFWLQLHLERESSGTALADLKNLVERGVGALKSADAQEFWLQHADACRRAASTLQDQACCWSQMRESFQRAVSISEAQTSDTGLTSQALLHWLRFEAYAARDAKGTMDIGDRLMKLWGSYYNGWSVFIAAVRFCKGGDSYSTVRDLYNRAMAQVIDYPSQIRNDYVQFELESGTLQSWREARDTNLECQRAESAAAAAVAPIAEEGDIEADIAAEKPQGVKKKASANVSGHEKKKRRRAKQAEEASGLVAEAHAVDTAKADESKQVDKQQFPVENTNGAAPSTSGTEVAAEKSSLSSTEKVTASTKADPVSTPDGKSVDAPASTDGKPRDEPVKVSTKTDEKPANEPVKKETADTAKQSQDVKEKLPSDASAREEREVEKAAEAHLGSHYHQKRIAAGENAPLKAEAEGEQTVYVSNLDWSVDEAQLTQLFGDVPGLKEVRLVRDFLKRSKGYAYVDFSKSEQVTKAVEKLNGYKLNKRAMFVARSLPTKPLFEERTVFVKNIGTQATESDIRDVFSPKGEILGVRLPTDDASGAHKGYAYVEFSLADSVTAALTLDGTEIGGQRVHVARSIPMKDHRHQTAASRKDLPQRSNQRQIVQGIKDRQDPVKQASSHPTTIYVKNLAIKAKKETEEVDEAKLQAHFSECGEVKQVMICRFANGRSRGFGFVEFADKDQAQAALAYNDTVLCGREIWVSKSQRAITQKGMVMGVAGQEKEAEPKSTAKAAGKAEPKAAAKAESKPPAKASTEEQKPVAAEAAAAGAPPPAVATAPPRIAGAKRRLDLGEKTQDAKADDGEKANAKSEPAKKQFRSVQGKAQAQPANEPTPSAKADTDADTGKEAEAPKPMSNADFRSLLLRN